MYSVSSCCLFQHEYRCEVREVGCKSVCRHVWTLDCHLSLNSLTASCTDNECGAGWAGWALRRFAWEMQGCTRIYFLSMIAMTCDTCLLSSGHTRKCELKCNTCPRGDSILTVRPRLTTTTSARAPPSDGLFHSWPHSSCGESSQRSSFRCISDPGTVTAACKKARFSAA